MSEEEKLIVEEPVEVSEEKADVDVSGLSREEIAAGRSSGVLLPDEEDKSKKEPEEPPDNKDKESEKDSTEKDTDENIDPNSFDSFEKVHALYNKDKKKFWTLPTNVRALYHNSKGIYGRLKTEEDRRSKDKEFFDLKEKGFVKKFADIEVILDKIESGDESLTTADIRKAIAYKKEQEEQEEQERKPDQKSNNDKVETERHQKYLQEKSKNAEMLGKAKYKDSFDTILEMANEVVASDKDFSTIIAKAFNDVEVDEEQLLDKIVKIAKTHPEYASRKALPSGEKKDVKEIDRIVANSKRKKTSASITSGSGRREISFNDLSLEDVTRLTQDQWNKVPSEVREKLLREASR